MSVPTGPAPSASEEWPPKPPVNSYPPQPSYPPSIGVPDHTRPTYQQVYIEQAPEQLEGEKLAKTSTILGIVSIYFLGIILGPIAIIKAAKAEKLGVDSTVGQVTGWIGTIFGAFYILMTILYVLFFAAMFSAMDTPSAQDSFNKGFSNTQEFGNNDGFSQDPSFGDNMKGSGYEELTPAEREYVEKSLTEVAADAAKQVN